MSKFRRLNSRYMSFSDVRILDEIGRGSNSTVFNCIITTTGEKLIVKRIEKRKLTDQSIVPLAIHFDGLCSMDHPNITRVYGFFEDNAFVYLLMEKLTGSDLYTHMEHREYFSEYSAQTLIRPILDALQYIHRLGFTHGDIKPENLLFSTPHSDAIIKFTDFGMNQFISPIFIKDACGSKSFRPPEMLKDEELGPYSDMWSLGMILYTLLAGKSPFDELDDQAILNGEYDHNAISHISQAGIELLNQLLHPDPSQRPMADAALNHRWFYENLSQMDMPSIMCGFREINARRRFKRAAYLAMAANRFRALGKIARLRSEERNDADSIVYSLLYIYIMHIIPENRDAIPYLLSFMHLKK